MRLIPGPELQTIFSFRNSFVSCSLMIGGHRI
jgi:hypothetical protein